jgi:hypothetical protein
MKPARRTPAKEDEVESPPKKRKAAGRG